jgi:hypothetical protein
MSKSISLYKVVFCLVSLPVVRRYVLNYAVVCGFVVLRCIEVCCFAWHFHFLLYFIVVHYLFCIVFRYCTLQYHALFCIALKHITWHPLWGCFKLHWSVLLCVTSPVDVVLYYYIACTSLPSVALFCSTLHYIALRRYCSVSLFCITLHYFTLCFRPLRHFVLRCIVGLFSFLCC